jgi:hypothetical protein
MTPNTFSGVGSLAGLGNLATFIDKFGYFASGSWNASQNTTVDKFSMISETGSVLAAQFPPSGGYRTGGASMSNNDVAGYGTTGRGSGNPSAAIWKLVFSAGTTSTLSGTFPLAFPAHVTGATNPGTAGYTFGGYGASGPTVISTIYKMPYSTETFASVGNTQAPVWVSSAVSNHGTSAIQTGGLSTSNQNTIWTTKLLVSNDTTSYNNNIYGYKHGMAGASNSGSKGYFFGGLGTNNNTFASTSYFNRVLRYTYSNDTPSNQSNILSAATGRSNTTSRTGHNAFLTLTNSSTVVNKYNYSTETGSVSTYSTSVSHDYAFSFSNSE